MMSSTGGESLKNTGERVLPYFENKIKPLIAEGKNIDCSSRQFVAVLIKELDNLSDDEIDNWKFQPVLQLFIPFEMG